MEHKAMMIGVVALAAAGCFYHGAETDATAVASSPDGRNEIRFYAQPLAYEVVRDGVTLVAKSSIGLTVDGVPCQKASRPVTVAKRALSGREASPVNKRASVDLTGNETFADFGDWGVLLVARNDGVAYRFETKKAGLVCIDGERADVVVADPKATCWFNRTNRFGTEETLTESAEAREVLTAADDTAKSTPGKRLVYLPFVFRTQGNTVAVTESDVRDYPIWNLVRPAKTEAAAFGSSFAGWPKATRRIGGWGEEAVEKGGRWVRVSEHENWLVKTSGTRTYPWRTFVLSDEPAGLVAADIVRALAAPAEAGSDFSWVRPGKVAWDWWNCFDNAPKGAPNGGCTTKTYKRFIDFAAKNGVEYVIFDEGWSEKLNIWKFHPEVDVPYLIDYANGKGVGIILWMAWAQVYGEEEKVAAHFAKLGAKGFKVDFMDRGDAGCARFLEKFAAACAKEHMLVDYHGAYRPTGLQRKYPNLLNYEGVHGLEQMKWHKDNYDFMANDVRLAFCRMMAGPMDYTPGAMLNFAKGTYAKHEQNKPGSYGTRCRQMAMMALFEAPLQMLCDSPTHYEQNAESFSFMAATPVVWNETLALGGDPDSFIALARQAKDGAWYAAAMTNWEPRDFTLDTAKFLKEGAWRVEIFRDADDAATVATHYVREVRTVKAGERLSLKMAPGGGFVARFSK